MSDRWDVDTIASYEDLAMLDCEGFIIELIAEIERLQTQVIEQHDTIERQDAEIDNLKSENFNMVDLLHRQGRVY